MILQEEAPTTAPEEKLNEIYITVLKNSVGHTYDDQKKRRVSWLSMQSSQDGVTGCRQIFHIHMILKVCTLTSSSESIIRSPLRHP
jgi:hypothetical protein